MRKFQLYSIILFITGVLLACHKDEDVQLVTLTLEDVKITAAYVSAEVELSIKTNATINEVMLEYAIDSTFAEYQEIRMQKKEKLANQYASSLSSLKERTKYYIRCKALNKISSCTSAPQSFSTKATIAPSVGKLKISNISYTTATCSGLVIADGGLTVTSRGVCYATTQNPTISNSKVTSGSGTGSFTCNLTGLTDGTTYYVRAYASNAKGTTYSDQTEFRTITYSIATVSTSNVSNITYTSATCGGNVTDDGGLTVTSRGVCYATTQNPTISNSKVTSGSGTGPFTCDLTGLTNGTTYYVRAYATNSKGTAYGSQIIVTTNPYGLPTLMTSNASNITYTSATCGGNVTDDGGLTITSRGICYATTQNPTISNSKVTSGSGTSSFTCNLIGLTAGTTYYVRSYATNSKGTAYGPQVSFTTVAYGLPTITTSIVTNISYTSATCGGDVTADGGQTIIERGVCYATTQNPTISNSKVTSGSGTGSFTCNLIGLTAGTTYYVRSYATNSKGTAYGNALQLSTLAPQVPTVSTLNNVSFDQGIVCAGSVVSSNGSDVIECGFIYSYENPNLTIENSYIVVDNDASFSGTVTDFKLNRVHYFRAYAKNAIGIGYGEIVTYMTPPPPILSFTANTKCTYTEVADGQYRVIRHFETNVEIQCSNPLNFPIAPIYYYYGHEDAYYTFTPENIAEHAWQLRAMPTAYNAETDTYQGSCKSSSGTGNAYPVGIIQLISYTICYGDTIWSDGIRITPKKK